MIKILTISFFIIFRLVSATFSVSEYKDLAADIKINLNLIRNIMKMEVGYTKEIKGLKSSLVKFDKAFLQPKVLRMFCGLFSDNDDFKTKILKKYQIDTCNPFAEKVIFEYLDRSKFSISLPENLSTVKFEKRCYSNLVKEFECLAENENEPIFKLNFDMHINPFKHQEYINAGLRKVIMRRIELYAATNNIQISGTKSTFHQNFRKMLVSYISSENSSVVLQEDSETD